MKTSSFLAILVSLLVISIISPSELTAKGPANPSNGHGRVLIPAHAIEVAPGIFSLGSAMDKGRVVEGYVIITSGKKKFAKPGCNNNGICEAGEKKNCSDCKGGDAEEPDAIGCHEYTRGVKWKSVEEYLVNPGNSRGLGEAFITQNLGFSIGKWEVAAEGYDILGYGNLTYDPLEADLVEPDDKNEVYFADVDYPGAIAITVLWGIFRGPPAWRGLVEWDQVYDDTDFDWSEDCLLDDEGCTDKMDFENVATHELGHAVGLNDLYDTKCSEQTMYGYADYGEIKKRDLANGDIVGISELY